MQQISSQQTAITGLERPKALFVNLSERMIDSPRQNRQMNALSKTHDIVTIGNGPSPSVSTFHVDVSYQPRKKIRNIDVLAFPRIILFMITSYFRLFSIGDHLQATSGNTISPRKIYKKIPKKHFEIVCGRDLHSLWLCRKVSSRDLIWIDLPDYTPLQQEDNALWRNTWGRYFHHAAKSLHNTKILTTTVSGGLADRFEKDYRIRPHLLLNVPQFEMSQTKESDLSKSVLRLVYSGAAIRSRGIHFMIQAVCNLNNVTLDMILMPTDKEYVEELKQFSCEKDNIKFRLPVERDQIISDLASYDSALIVVAPSNFNNANCLPNKFFEAIQARIPIISGPTPDMKQIIEKNNLGIVASDFSVEAISAAIQTMMEIFNNDGLARFQDGLEDCAKMYSAVEQDTQLVKILTDALSNLKSG